jgi:hypothetical protein
MYILTLKESISRVHIFIESFYLVLECLYHLSLVVLLHSF